MAALQNRDFAYESYTFLADFDKTGGFPAPASGLTLAAVAPASRSMVRRGHRFRPVERTIAPSSAADAGCPARRRMTVMETPPAAPLAPVPPKPRRRRWLRGVLLLLALAVLAPLCIFAYMTWTVHHNWAQAEAETDRSLARWRLQQLIEEQEPIPD